MSLLTSDGSPKIGLILRKLTSWSLLLSTILFLAGLAFLCYLIQEPDQAYFSENALLPGLANREFTESRLADQHLDGLRRIYGNKSLNGDEKEDEFEHFLLDAFDKINMKVWRQQFSVQNPLVASAMVNGTNLYAIFRAPRAASTEAIVLSTSRSRGLMLEDEEERRDHLPSVALMLALAKFFSSKFL